MADSPTHPIVRFLIPPEVWQPWRSGEYEVSSYGRVRTAEGQELRGANSRGYRVVSTLREPTQTHPAIHQMVAEVFIGPPPPKDRVQINHKDAIRTNNFVENLEYVSIQENLAHCRKLGRHNRGERNGGARLTAEQVLAIRAEIATGTRGIHTRIAARLGVARATISLIAERRTWRHV